MIGPWPHSLTAAFKARLPASFQQDKLPFVFFCMMLLVVVSLTFSLFNPYPYGSAFQVVFAALILGLLWLLHRGVALEIILHVMCLLSLIYLLNAARLSGGVFSFRLLWLMVIPV